MILRYVYYVSPGNAVCYMHHISHVKKCGLFFLITPTMQNFFDVYLKITFSNSRQPLKLLFKHYNFGDFEKFFEWKLGRYV